MDGGHGRPGFSRFEAWPSDVELVIAVERIQVKDPVRNPLKKIPRCSTLPSFLGI